MKTVSVIIPLYNKARYIRRALESVLAQTYAYYEVVVIDDGSSDEGPELVGSYKDSRVRLIRQQNAGPGAARNRGLAESNGSLVAFLDADDEWLPEFLGSCVSALASHPDCDVAAAAYFLGESRADVSGVFRRYGMTEGPWRLSRDISDRELKHAIYILVSSATVCKRRAVERYGGFYTANRCKLGEDYYLWLQVMFNHKIYRILKPLWWYHIEASELCRQSPPNKAMQPFLTDVKPIKNKCPADLCPLLERWLAQYALSLAHEYGNRGHTFQARQLIRRFPRMKDFHWEYGKLRIKIFMPRLVPLVGGVKRGILTAKNLLSGAIHYSGQIHP